MTFKQRLPYFLGGLVIGIIFVIFVLGKKNTSFDYSPNARVLKNIRTKNHIYSEEATAVINFYNIDTASISTIFKKGNVDIWNKIKLDSCIRYRIKGRNALKNMILTVKNCDSTAYIEKITVE